VKWIASNFKYARGHFALDALDSYADTADDPTRPVPNPAKADAKTAVETARATVHGAGAARDHRPWPAKPGEESVACRSVELGP
jgi:hypothetical protein